VNHEDLLKDPAIRKLLREFQPNDILFKQGEHGSTLYIIIEGKIELHQKTATLSRLVETVGPGEILGEKAVIFGGSYKRRLTAKAQTEVAVLEIDPMNWKWVLTRLPNFPVQMLRIVSIRLDRANELVGILMLKEDLERIAHYLIYLCRHYGTKTSNGFEISVNPEKTSADTNCDLHRVQEFLAFLHRQGILIPTGSRFLLTDEGALMAALPQIREQLAA